MIEKILKAGPAMLGSAWEVESGRVKEQFVEARKLLQASYGDGSEDYNKAYDPLLSLQKEAVGHKKAKKWQLALEVLSDLSDKLDDLVFPDATEEDASELEDLADSWGDLSELEDDEPLEDFSEVSDEELTRITQAAEADLAVRKGSRKGHRGLTAFIKALKDDSELMDQLEIDASFVDGLLDVLPDLSPLLDALHKTLASHGDENAFEAAADEVDDVFAVLDDDLRLKAFETTDLGTFEIATPLEQARDACASLLK